jgi:hypothetical protein
MINASDLRLYQNWTCIPSNRQQHIGWSRVEALRR